jgi:hypothetical protein
MNRTERSSPAVRVPVILVIAAAMLAAAPAGAAETGGEDGWEFGLAIYGWLPDIEGSLSQEIPGQGSELKVDAETLIDNLDMTAQVAFEARRGRWLILANVLYLAEEAQESDAVKVPGIPGLVLDTDARLDLSSWITGLAGGRVLAENDRVTLSALFGLRYFTLDTDLEIQIDGPLPGPLPTRRFSQEVELWDAVVGLRGRIHLGEHWFIPYHLDAGAGDSDLTWQALAGFGYRFRWGSVMAAYRSLNYDQGSDKPVEDFTFAGPALAVTFRF